ncbi:hypothetical protein M011DRAFT_469290 [Sporormia fimetaria CBS 119925]|uniref:SPX domain-containing protein n=1 Tax=Sporormia fimetaria CBS 119925 TaxID=1340428 RepID=A0A6A6V4Y8_9PLEO|nr:hypothetical protein M011DRAFT_469290 [Sporormia fimetaria CBS 119925]
MKYGDTLQQRSIPEWSHYNIDYDHLKDLIKHHTTPGAGNPLSIPGQGSTTEQAFSATFFDVLRAQHDRINLFIKSKSGEIERRLAHIGKQLANLQSRQPWTRSESVPARRIEKYAKIDADLARAGEEVKSLSRFRVAQCVGFNKILKKYKRWTKDRDLERRFKQEVLNRPDSFFQVEPVYLLDQYTQVLGMLRAATAEPGATESHVDPKQASSAARLTKAVEERSPVDFDLAMSKVPLGPHASRPTYWVHPDHIVELEVLLLQYLRPYARTTRAREWETVVSASKTGPSTAGTGEDAGFVVLDDPAAFANKQNAVTVAASEELEGTIPSKAAGLVRWTTRDPVAVAMEVNVQPGSSQERVKLGKVRRKQLHALLHEDVVPDQPAEYAAQSENIGDCDAHELQGWLTNNGDKRPIAVGRAKRSRFFGLHNSASAGVWATLDREIQVSRGLSGEPYPFPHAVLEIRRENVQSPALIHLLDRSHLVERVRGFSLEAHAVWTCCKPPNMSPPIWITMLGQDIRKLPALERRQRRSAPSTATNSAAHLSPSRASTSVASDTSPYRSYNDDTSATEVMEPPPLRAFQKKRKPRNAFSQAPETIAPDRGGYWNEYDNPESDEDEGYYIYIDPNASVKFPGQELLEAWIRKTRHLLRLERDEGRVDTDGSVDEDDGESGEESEYGANNNNTSYGTIAPSLRPSIHTQESFFARLLHTLAPSTSHDPEHSSLLLHELSTRQRERESILFKLYTSCLCAAVVLDIVLVILTTTSRRKLRREVDVTVCFGVVASFLLTLLAVWSVRLRRERVGGLQKGVVLGVVVGVCAVGGWLVGRGVGV